MGEKLNIQTSMDSISSGTVGKPVLKYTGLGKSCELRIRVPGYWGSYSWPNGLCMIPQVLRSTLTPSLTKTLMRL